MELLKFSDSPKSARRGKNPAAFIGAGIMVAVMGLSSTLAGTISINSGATVEFGQGIVSTAACDSTITVTPTSTYSYSSDTFTVNTITLSNIGWDSSGVVADDLANGGRGCRNQVFELRAYSASGALLPFHNDTVSTLALTIYIPNDSATASSFRQGFYNVDAGEITGATKIAGQPTLTTTGAMRGGTANLSGTSALSITVGGLKLPAAVQRLTLESRKARTGSDEAS